MVCVSLTVSVRVDVSRIVEVAFEVKVEIA